MGEIGTGSLPCKARYLQADFAEPRSEFNFRRSDYAQRCGYLVRGVLPPGLSVADWHIFL